MKSIFSRHQEESAEKTTYKKLLEIVNAIDAFMAKTHCKSFLENGSFIKHTEVDKATIRVLVLDYMRHGFACIKQKNLAQKVINVKTQKPYSRQTICEALGRLENAGFIYKILRFRGQKTHNQYGEFEGGRKTSLMYKLMPNLKNRIFEALKNGLNYLKKITLANAVKQINLYKDRIVSKFFNGQTKTEYITAPDAIKRKKEQKQDFIDDYKQKQYAKTADKPEHEKSMLDKALSAGLALFRKTQPQTS